MIRRNVVLALTFVFAVGAIEACGGNKAETAPAPTQSALDAAAQRRADSIAAADAAAQRAAAAARAQQQQQQQAQARSDSVARANAAAARASEAARAAAVQNELMGVIKQQVYFDYDKDAIRDDQKSGLDAKLPILTANSGVSLVITGHTDERGTPEYNLALGQRRAAQVKRYLQAKGIAEGRLTTQSLGESQPAVQGSDESAYKMNRRAEFEAMNAGNLVRP